MHQMNFLQDLRFLLGVPPSNFSCENGEGGKKLEITVSVDCSLDTVSKKLERLNRNTERCMLLKKKLVRAFFRLALYSPDVLVLRYFPLLLNFHLVRELVSFCVLICVQKTVSMKILVLCVTNSQRYRKCFVRGYVRSLLVSKTLILTCLARSGFWHKYRV